MLKTTLQIPISATLKQSATLAAEDLGFSSLQELIRVMLKQVVDRQVQVSIQPAIPLSVKAEDRYQKIDQDFKEGKNSSTVSSADELLSELNAD
jgi:antitoxin component of RelBE/YafQ-DinJ toxin-antitoxin module